MSQPSGSSTWPTIAPSPASIGFMSSPGQPYFTSPQVIINPLVFQY